MVSNLSAASERFGRCSLTADEDVGRTAPLTTDKDVGRRSLAADEEVGQPVLAADTDVGQPARMSARPGVGRCQPPRGNRGRGGGWPPSPRLRPPLRRHLSEQGGLRLRKVSSKSYVEYLALGKFSDHSDMTYRVK